LSGAQIFTGQDGRAPNEHLVAIHPEVLRDAEHTLGNLFQRIYHATRLNRESLGVQGERLTSAVEDLEGVVELVFDYVTPVELELRPTPLQRVAESFAAEIRSSSKAEVVVGECTPVSVLVDSRRLRRCFQLVGRACETDWAAAQRVSIDIRRDTEAEQAEIFVSYPRVTGNNSSRSDSLLWAVAGRLIELHGGALRCSSSTTAGTCSFVLPTVTGDDAGV